MAEIEKYLEMYWKTFGEGLPAYQVMRGRTDDEVIQIVKHCIDENKDVYQLGYAELDDDIMY